MNMQKLSVLVNYVIDQYLHILQAKTRKICEILSKKTGIGEREKYTKRHRGGKRESKSGHFNPQNLTLSFSHHVSFSLLFVFLSFSHPVSLSLSLSLSTLFSLSPTLSLSPHPFLFLSHRLLSLSLFPPPLFLFLSFSPLSLSLSISLSLFQFYSLIVLCKKNQEFVSGLKYLTKIK